jgi:cob(I)alamin adenosyltransferase
MGNRISKVYTRTGDNGTTGLGDGSRIAKDSPRIAALGDIDELNCLIGLLLTETLPTRITPMLVTIQHDLFDAGGEVSIPGFTRLTAAHVQQLEQWLDSLNQTLPPLKEFILPGGSRAAALSHLARSICRRAERMLTTVANTEIINPETPKYLNRLSDLLFVIARFINRDSGHDDVLWQKDRPQPHI